MYVSGSTTEDLVTSHERSDCGHDLLPHRVDLRVYEGKLQEHELDSDDCLFRHSISLFHIVLCRISHILYRQFLVDFVDLFSDLLDLQYIQESGHHPLLGLLLWKIPVNSKHHGYYYC